MYRRGDPKSLLNVRSIDEPRGTMLRLPLYTSVSSCTKMRAFVPFLQQYPFAHQILPFFSFFVVVTILRNFELLLATIGIAFDAGGSH